MYDYGHSETVTDARGSYTLEHLPAGEIRVWAEKDAAREEGLAIARETLIQVRDLVQGVQVSAPFGRVQYALDVFSVL